MVSVLVAKTFESCAITAKNTEWCTKHKFAYEHHKNEGNVFFRFLFKNGYRLRLTWNLNNRFNWGGVSIAEQKTSGFYPNLMDYKFDGNPFEIKPSHIEELRKNVKKLQKRLKELLKQKNTKNERFYFETPSEDIDYLIRVNQNAIKGIEDEFYLINKINDIPLEAQNMVITYHQMMTKQKAA